MLFVQVGKQQKEKLSETAVHRGSSKWLFLKTFLKYCQENNCVGSPFNKVAGLKVFILLKEKTPTQLLSCEYCGILKKFFVEHLTALGTTLIFFLFLVPLLCFPS